MPRWEEVAATLPYPDLRGARCLHVGNIGDNGQATDASRALLADLDRRGAIDVVRDGGDPAELELERVGGFDVVVAVNVLVDHPDPPAAVAGMARVCGGVVLSIEPIDAMASLRHRGRAVIEPDPTGERRWRVNGSGHRAWVGSATVRTEAVTRPFLVPPARPAPLVSRLAAGLLARHHVGFDAPGDPGPGPPPGRPRAGAPAAMTERAARLALVARLVADPPVVHPMAPGDDAPLGVWSTDADCYRFLAERCGPGTRTLETGCGTSTVLFAGWGCHHTCVTPGAAEVERVRAHCGAIGVDLDDVGFEVASSHEALPRLSGELDVVLVDGGHGFPLPIVDWLYAGDRLGVGGIMVIDDVHLPAVRTLLAFLDRDPRWAAERRTPKWAAYRRLEAGPLAEDWTAQPFYVVHPPGAVAFVRRVLGRARRDLARLGGAAQRWRRGARRRP